MTRRRINALLFVATGYYLAGRLGLAVPNTSGNVSPVWPAAGVALAAFVVFGRSIWPAVAVGAFLVNAVTRIPAASALVIAIGNTAGPMAGAWMLRRSAAFDPSLGRLRDVFRLVVLGAFGGTAISATLGTIALALGGVHAWASAGERWVMWWIGDAMGVLVAGPLVLCLSAVRKGSIHPSRWLELGALLFATSICSVLVFRARPELGNLGYGALALTFPYLLMWGASRFEVLGAALITTCLTVVAAWESRMGSGPFVVGTALNNAALLQSFVTIIAVSGLSAAALSVERARLTRQEVEREAARRAERRFREIAETAAEGVWMLDERLLTCFVNRRLVQLLGYSSEEMLGKPVTSFAFPADTASKVADLERRKRGVSEQLETRYRRKDGSEMWARVSTTGSFDADGKFTGVLAMVSDVTEQKQREAEGRVSRQEILLLTRAVEQTADSVLVTNRQGIIEYVNPAFEATTGYSRAEAVGRTPSLLKSGHHDAEFYKRLWDDITQGRSFSGTLVNRKKTGELYWAEQTITPIRDDTDGEITHFVSVLKDVTELRRTHEREVQLRLARQVQQRFYQRPAEQPGLELAAVSRPATETGGDYFDFVQGPGDSVYVAVGDASGHGLGAALVMALTRAYVRSFAALSLDVGEILTKVNRMLAGDLEENRFVTLLLVHIDVRGRLVRWANAGHVPGFVISGSDGGRQEVLPSTGIPLGVFPEAGFQSRQLRLEPPDTLLLVTDGITESAARNDVEFGVDRLVAYARSHLDASAQSLAEGVCEAAREFAAFEPQSDDLTSVVAKVTRAA